MGPTKIKLVVALPPEAKPVNRHLGLVRDNSHKQYPIYHRDHISLVISGPGMEAAAAATKWLYSLDQHNGQDIWINLGIAGHPDHPIGKIFLANRIENRQTGQHWHLADRPALPCPAESVVSVQQPDSNYETNALVEMEAAGFYQSALQCTEADKIYCLKVVSDNLSHPANRINGKLVTQLIQQNLQILDQLITLLSPNGGDR